MEKQNLELMLPVFIERLMRDLESKKDYRHKELRAKLGVLRKEKGNYVGSCKALLEYVEDFHLDLYGRIQRMEPDEVKRKIDKKIQSEVIDRDDDSNYYAEDDSDESGYDIFD